MFDFTEFWQSHDIQFDNLRLQCPKCAAKRGFAPAISIGSVPLEKGFYYKCHACNTKELPPIEWYKQHFPGYITNGNNAANRNYLKAIAPLPKAMDKPVLPKNELAEEIRVSQLNILSLLSMAKHSNFHKYYISLFGQLGNKVAEAFKQHLANWWVGTDYKGYTSFLHHDYYYEPATIKAIQYNPNGKRNKENGYSIRYGFHHAVDKANWPNMNQQTKFVSFKKEHGFKFLFYGIEQLRVFEKDFKFQRHNYWNGKIITYNKDTPVIIVESEKTVVISSFYFPQYIFLALGGKSFSEEKAKYLTRFTNIFINLDNETEAQERAKVITNLIKKVKKESRWNCTNHQIQIINAEDFFNFRIPGGDLADYIEHEIKNNKAHIKQQDFKIENLEDITFNYKVRKG